MIEYKYAIYYRVIDFVLDRLQFKKLLVENNLNKQDWETNQPTNWSKSRSIVWQTWQITVWWNQNQLKTVMQNTKIANKQNRK